MRSSPAQAIIDALSVQSASGGATKQKPCASHSACNVERNTAFAATPPATTSAGECASG
jgi:hypothetical protein